MYRPQNLKHKLQKKYHQYYYYSKRIQIPKNFTFLAPYDPFVKFYIYDF